MRKGDDPKFLVERWSNVYRLARQTISNTSNSNIGNSEVSKKQIRCKKSTSGFVDVMKPNSLEDYNKNMGGTDLADQCFQYYSHIHRNLKWWKRVCFHLRNICTVDARSE